MFAHNDLNKKQPTINQQHIESPFDFVRRELESLNPSSYRAFYEKKNSRWELIPIHAPKINDQKQKSKAIKPKFWSDLLDRSKATGEFVYAEGGNGAVGVTPKKSKALRLLDSLMYNGLNNQDDFTRFMAPQLQLQRDEVGRILFSELRDFLVLTGLIINTTAEGDSPYPYFADLYHKNSVFRLALWLEGAWSHEKNYQINHTVFDAIVRLESPAMTMMRVITDVLDPNNYASCFGVTNNKVHLKNIEGIDYGHIIDRWNKLITVDVTPEHFWTTLAIDYFDLELEDKKEILSLFQHFLPLPIDKSDKSPEGFMLQFVLEGTNQFRAKANEHFIIKEYFPFLINMIHAVPEFVQKIDQQSQEVDVCFFTQLRKNIIFNDQWQNYQPSVSKTLVAKNELKNFVEAGVDRKNTASTYKSSFSSNERASPVLQVEATVSKTPPDATNDHARKERSVKKVKPKQGGSAKKQSSTPLVSPVSYFNEPNPLKKPLLESEKKKKKGWSLPCSIL